MGEQLDHIGLDVRSSHWIGTWMSPNAQCLQVEWLCIQERFEYSIIVSSFT